MNVSDNELAHAAGYRSGKVVEMIKAGIMRLPVNKAVAFADALQVDRRKFFCTVLEQSTPELLQVIHQVFGPGELTESERNLICHLRALTGEREAKPMVFDGAGVIALVAVAK